MVARSHEAAGDAPRASMSLADLIQRGEATVNIMGLGRVGLPLAISFAKAGLKVVGTESEAQRRAAIRLGKLPFHLPGAERILSEVVTSEYLTLQELPSNHADVFILCLGTPLGSDLRPDYSQLLAALDQLAPLLLPGRLLILRSTVSPGTLEKVVKPRLEALGVSDLLLATCPERIAEGRSMTEILELPEIVGGLDQVSIDAAAALFRTLNPAKIIHKTDPTSADLAKLFTNVYRYVNFALANEFALLAEYYGADVNRILEMVNTDYPRANVPGPGPAGGPCLSKDGYFLVEELTMPDFVLLAWKLNDSIPAYTIRRLARRLSSHNFRLGECSIAVLGQAFKRDSDDTRQSPAVRIAGILKREGCEVRTHDPFHDSGGLDETLEGAHAFVIATNHSAYDALLPADVARSLAAPRVGLDCWGGLDRDIWRTAGIDLVTFGVGEEL